jgi:hypothetical protein
MKHHSMLDYYTFGDGHTINPAAGEFPLQYLLVFQQL